MFSLQCVKRNHRLFTHHASRISCLSLSTMLTQRLIALHKRASFINLSALYKPSPRRLMTAWVIGCLLLSPAFDVAAQRGRKPSPSANHSMPAAGALKVITGQAGSVVFINHVRHGATNDKGELDLPRVRAGSYP